MARLAYGVHGYGCGHATRSLPTIQALQEEGHEVTVFSGGQAKELLSAHLDVIGVPCLSFHQTRPGKTDATLSLLKNLPLLSDLFMKGPGYQSVREVFDRQKFDAVITDAEPWSSWVAKDMRIPVISFDHYGVIAWCKPKMSLFDRMKVQNDIRAYKTLIPFPHRILVSSFYEAKPVSSNVKVVPSILRNEVKELTPFPGNHVLAYFSMGMAQSDLDSLQYFDEVRLYGTRRFSSDGSIHYKPPSTDEFLRDLASCRMVVSGAGNQLIGEAMHYGKPVLVIPENSVEQRVNAHYVADLGLGMAVPKLTMNALRKFEKVTEGWRKSDYRPDGLGQALETIGQWLKELVTAQ